MTINMLFWLVFYLVFFLLSVFIGYRKGNVIAGILLGYVLGPIGALLMYLSKDKNHILCPSCQHSIHRQSYYCPKCKSKVRLALHQ